MADEAVIRVVVEGGGAEGEPPQGGAAAPGAGGAQKQAPIKPPAPPAPLLRPVTITERTTQFAPAAPITQLVPQAPPVPAPAAPPGLGEFEFPVSEEDMARFAEEMYRLGKPLMAMPPRPPQPPAPPPAPPPQLTPSLPPPTSPERPPVALPEVPSYEDVARRRRQRELERAREKAAYQNLFEGPGEALPAEEKPKGVGGDVLKLLGKVPGLGGAGGLAEGLGGAAGIAGAAVAVAKKVQDDIVKAVKGAISRAGDVAVGLADTAQSPGRDIGRVGEHLKGMGADLEKVNPLLGAMASVAGEAVSQLGRFVEALDKTADRFAPFSPDLAIAQAQADIRETLGDMRRAQEVGPELVRFVRARSDLQQRYEDIKIRFLTKILPIVTTHLKMAEAGATSLDAGFRLLSAFFTANTVPGGLAAAMDEWKKIREELEKMNRPDFSDHDPTNIVLQGGLAFPEEGG